MANRGSSTTPYSVVVVGAGPVGLSLGICLARCNHNVLVVERTDQKKQNPRAIVLNGESQRLLVQKVGLGDGWIEQTMPANTVKTALGRLRFVTEFPNPKALDAQPDEDINNPLSREANHLAGPSGFNDATFFQPELMKRLLEKVAELPNLELRLNTKLVDFREKVDGKGATLMKAVCQEAKMEWVESPGGEFYARDASHDDALDEPYAVFCKYIVGCDGVNSRVRDIIMNRASDEYVETQAKATMDGMLAAIDMQGGRSDGVEAEHRGARVSLSYADTRVVIDVKVLKEDIIGKKLSRDYLQVCAPQLPATIIPSAWATGEHGGKRHWRFEIIVMDDKVDATELINNEAGIYTLLSPYVAKDDVKIIRSAIYHPTAGQSIVWHLGQAFIAGDSAHHTPPWLGQGLNQGFLDVWNLVWKLDLCLRGRASEDLLRSYEQERKPDNAQQLVSSCRAGSAVLQVCRIAAETNGEFEALKRGFDRVMESMGKRPFQLQYMASSDYAKLVLPGGTPVSTDKLGKLLPQPMEVPTEKGKVPLDTLIGDGFTLLTAFQLELRSTTISKLQGLKGIHYMVPRAVMSQLGSLFDDGVVAALVRPDHIVCATARSAEDIDVILSCLAFTLGARSLERLSRAFIVSTGSAFGNHYTTEQMKTFFAQHRGHLPNVQEWEVSFAHRLLDACSYDSHSICLPPEDVFRRFTRSEYLDHRMTNLLGLAKNAAEDAFKLWGGRREDITHLYWGTMTGGMHSPTIDIRLAKLLGLSNDVSRVSIEGMGCLTGYRCMNLAREAANADPNARILCVAADLRSAIGNSLPDVVTKSDIVSAGLFRDAASSCIVSGANLTKSETVYYEIASGLSRIVPNTEHCVDYRELDDGAIRLLLSKELPIAVGQALPSFTDALIHKARAEGFDVPPLSSMDVACHTGGPRLLLNVQKGTGVSKEALASTFAVMRQHGNLSGASNLAVLDHHNHDCTDSEEDNKWVFCLSMGPGMCMEGALVRRMHPVEEPADVMSRSVTKTCCGQHHGQPLVGVGARSSIFS